jgi:tRNA threonylcarbamoyladenosine biosynthesis protein TsaB
VTVNVLGFDTATPATSVGVLSAAGDLFEARDVVAPGGRGHHAERVLVEARELLAAAALDWSDIGLVAVGVGPGGYTGLRIGLATARGLAFAVGARLVGVGTLRALAEPLRPLGAITILDARRGELFVAAYRDDVEVLAPCVIGPPQLPDVVARAGNGPWLAVGDGAPAHRATLERLEIAVEAADSPANAVAGGAICRLAARAEDGPVTALYLRRPDAELALTGER